MTVGECLLVNTTSFVFFCKLRRPQEQFSASEPECRSQLSHWLCPGLLQQQLDPPWTCYSIHYFLCKSKRLDAGAQMGETGKESL